MPTETIELSYTSVFSKPIHCREIRGFATKSWDKEAFASDRAIRRTVLQKPNTDIEDRRSFHSLGMDAPMAKHFLAV
jgi:hypothetical protein